MALFLFTVLFNFAAHAQPTAATVADVSLPTVTAADFIPGRQWTWDYFEILNHERIYSTERYTVLERNGSVVLIELSSDYDGHQNLKPNHRLRVDVDQCLRAYRNPVQKQPWRFEMFYLATIANGTSVWTEVDPPSTLAFEEKFNCNSREYQKPSAPYLTVYGDDRGQPVFMQKLWRRIPGSWFYMTGLERGVAASKEFSGNAVQKYTFRLRPK